MTQLEQDILRQIRLDKDMMTILKAIHQLHLKDSWLCAGSVRNFIWNILSDQKPFDRETDVDVIFFDEAVSEEETEKIEQIVKKEWPQYHWQVRNQVYMYPHSPHTLPYRDSKDAISKFPERCTAIGVRLIEQEQIELVAPYGLDDIEHFLIAPTPHFLSNPERMNVYLERMQRKNWQKKWPMLQLL